MHVLIHVTHPFGQVEVAGMSCLDRMRAVLAHLKCVVNETTHPSPQLSEPEEQLWICGLFPLMDQTFLEELITRGRAHGSLVCFADGHQDLGILYLSADQKPGDNFTAAAAGATPHTAPLQPFTCAADFPILTRAAFQYQAERAMADGVLIHDPALAWIEAGVTLEAGVMLEPSVYLGGSTHLAAGVRVGMGAVLRDVTVAAGTVIKPYSVLDSAKVGADAAIGPFAHVRPGTQLGDRVKVGNFVETKKVIMGNDSKASHLAYLGDAEIGSDCNIGAGTITCNYDGYNKHKTQLGDGVFIGSDSQLVAPVKLGDGAYVAAGSSIVEDVPNEALAIARGRQIIKENRATQLRERARALKEQSS